MPIPLIGVTTYRTPSKYGYAQNCVSEAYTSSLASAGAAPLLIPVGLPEPGLDALWPRLDGILFTGGGDIDPQQYGGEPHPFVSDVDIDRDRMEIHLFNHILEDRLPFLGICRGLQVINVALGGSLYEDIIDQRPDSLKHQYFPDWPRDYLAHTIQIENDSRLASILGAESLQVNSLHHQGVRRLAPGLQASAYAPDGLIEAFELPGHPYGLAVQWHPENLQAHAPMQALFRSFVQAIIENKEE
ncbi:MAG: gamma-glutamyl-gamma-aminobutyrate hydrolase family protein [Anaerolineales bacterium]|nr:gamma-glutamyl-gamma-aminobutyrate hydrolase family protein [Anaerolineales bacterium]